MHCINILRDRKQFIKNYSVRAVEQLENYFTIALHSSEVANTKVLP